MPCNVITMQQDQLVGLCRTGQGHHFFIVAVVRGLAGVGWHGLGGCGRWKRPCDLPILASIIAFQRSTSSVRFRTRSVTTRRRMGSMGQLSGKVAAVTGGASGIGEATGRRFIAEGGQGAFADRDVESGQRVAAEIAASGGPAAWVETPGEKEGQVPAFT